MPFLKNRETFVASIDAKIVQGTCMGRPGKPGEVPKQDLLADGKVTYSTLLSLKGEKIDVCLSSKVVM